MKSTYQWVGSFLMVFILPAATVFSQAKGNADVLFVQAVETTTDVWTFDVTVSHPDTG